MRTGLSAAPIDLFGTSGEVKDLCAAKVDNGFLVVALYLSSTALTKYVVHFLRLGLSTCESTPMTKLVVKDFNEDLKTKKNFTPVMQENITFLSLLTPPTAVTTPRTRWTDLVFQNQSFVQHLEHTPSRFSDYKPTSITIKDWERTDI